MSISIRLKRSSVPGESPQFLLPGEVAVNITDKKLWIGDINNNPVEIVGIQGPTGNKGPTGDVGPLGPVGPQGPSADAVITFNGLTGAVQGVSSFNGLTGAVSFVNYISSFNGLTGAVQGVSSFNGLTGAVSFVNYISSFNGLTGAVQGVSSFNGLTGAVQGVSSFNGLTGAVSFVNYISSFNGLTGAVQGVSSFNGLTGAVQGVSSFNGLTGAVQGVSSFNGLTGAVQGVSSFNGATGAITSRTISVFTPLQNQPPGTSFATIDTRNSIAVLDFDDSSQESAMFVGIVPEISNFSGLLVKAHWMATSATGGTCCWGVQFEKMTTDLDSDSFDSGVTAATLTGITSGIPKITEITTSSIDGILSGDLFRLKIYRDAANASDTMTGDAELIAIELRTN